MTCPFSTLDLPIRWRCGRGVRVLPRIDSGGHLVGMFSNHLAAALDVIFHLGTTLRYRLLASLYIVVKLIFTGVDIGIYLRRRFSGFLLQVFGAFARAFGQTLAGICSSLGSIQHTNRCTNAKPYQKPAETTSATVVFNFV